MLYFWIFAAVLIFIVVTYMGFQDGFEVWAYYYIFGGIALFAAITRRWMMKRMEKHTEFLNNQKEKED